MEAQNNIQRLQVFDSSSKENLRWADAMRNKQFVPRGAAPSRSTGSRPTTGRQPQSKKTWDLQDALAAVENQFYAMGTNDEQPGSADLSPQ